MGQRFIIDYKKDRFIDNEYYIGYDWLIMDSSGYYNDPMAYCDTELSAREICSSMNLTFEEYSE